jgi:predicted DNA-binding WGR domain protein
VPLFELEEGPHHKFYRVERIGKRLELHWGRIGTAGQKKTLELGSEHEARREYELEIARRRERGYRQVVDEAAPRDSDEARQHKLAATGALTKYPRFVFRKRELITWVEVRGNVLVTASGLTDEALTPSEQPFDSEQAALRERDRLMAELVGKGYALDEFGAAEAPAAKRRAPKLGELMHHPEIEAQLEAAPDDPNAWLVFEDWLLDARDPRATIIEHERSGDVTAAAQARGTLKKLLFGGRGATFDAIVSRASWRAGFIRSCVIDATGSRGGHRLAELVAAPATKFLTELELDVSDFAVLGEPAPAKLITRLRVRHERISIDEQTACDASVLEPLGRLSELELRRVSSLKSHPCLSRVRRLLVEYAHDTELDTLAEHELTKLESLRIDLINDAASQLTTPLAPVMPALRELHIVGWGRGFALVEQVIASKLAPQLSRLVVHDGGELVELDAADRERVFAGAFAGIAYVQLPKMLVQ